MLLDLLLLLLLLWYHAGKLVNNRGWHSIVFISIDVAFLLIKIVRQGPHVDISMQWDRSDDWVFWVPRHLPGRWIFWMLRCEHRCRISSLRIVDINVTVGWARAQVPLASCFNWRKVTLQVHILHVMPFEGQNGLVIRNLDLFISQRVVLAREIENWLSWLLICNNFVLWKHHAHVPQLQ